MKIALKLFIGGGEMVLINIKEDDEGICKIGILLEDGREICLIAHKEDVTSRISYEMSKLGY